MTTLIHEDARPSMVYAHKIEWPKAKGAVTSDNWYSALLELQETRQARESMRDVWEWMRSNSKGAKLAAKSDEIFAEKVASKPKAIPVSTAKPRKSPRTAQRTAPKPEPVDTSLPVCPVCSARFAPELKSVKYCQDCRKNRRAEVKRHVCREYHKRYPELKKQREQIYRESKRPEVPPCQMCGEVILPAPTRCHRQFCDACRAIKAKEHKRAYNQKRTSVYKAALAMGVQV